MRLSLDNWNDFKKKVSNELIPNLFISYAYEDRAFVERLGGDLRVQGLHVWIDLWEMRVGDSIAQKIKQGVEESDYLVIVLSPNSVRSDWVQTEFSSDLTQDLNDRSVKILPVLFRDCNIPPLLLSFHCTDFRREDKYQENFKRLIEAIEPAIATSSITVQGSDASANRSPSGGRPGDLPPPEVQESDAPLNRSPDQKLLIQLREFFTGYFSEEELRTFCFDQEIDYNDLQAEGKANKARELVAYYARRGRIRELKELARLSRPGVSWDDAADQSNTP